MNKSYWTGFLSGTTVLALGMTAILAGSGFQGANMKIGIVDTNDVAQQVATNKNLVEQQKNLESDRQAVVDFLQHYPILKKEEADRFKTLQTKATKTDAEKAELEKIKSTAEETLRKLKDLELKSSPTQDELKYMDEYRQRQEAMGPYIQGLVNDFREELTNIRSQNQNLVVKAVTAGIAEVGKKQGYTLLFDKNTAPYAANDVTADVLKASMKQ